MHKKQFTRPLTILLPEELFSQIQGETEQAGISLGRWFREAALLKIKTDKEVIQNAEEK